MCIRDRFTLSESNISKCQVLQKLGIKIGSNKVKVMKKLTCKESFEADTSVDELMKRLDTQLEM